MQLKYVFFHVIVDSSPIISYCHESKVLLGFQRDGNMPFPIRWNCLDGIFKKIIEHSDCFFLVGTYNHIFFQKFGSYSAIILLLKQRYTIL